MKHTHQGCWFAGDSWTLKQELLKKAQRDANRTRDREMVHAHEPYVDGMYHACNDGCVLVVPEAV